MSNIIHSSSLLNLADGTSEPPVDLSKPEETQQGIDFKDIYENLTNEINRKSPPDHQIPKDGFQKDLETISDPKKADSGKVEQKIPQVQQPSGKIFPTLVAHQRGLSFEKAILTAPVSAVSEYSLKEFIKRQNTVDEVIDRGRSTSRNRSAAVPSRTYTLGCTPSSRGNNQPRWPSSSSATAPR